MTGIPAPVTAGNAAKENDMEAKKPAPMPPKKSTKRPTKRGY